MYQAPISPAEFDRRMAKLIVEHRDDPLSITALGAALMATTLMSIGYASGVERLAEAK